MNVYFYNETRSALERNAYSQIWNNMR